MSARITPIALAAADHNEGAAPHLHAVQGSGADRMSQLAASNRALTLSLFGAEQRIGELLKLVVVLRRLFEARTGREALLNMEEILVTVLGTEDYAVVALDSNAEPRLLAAMGEAGAMARMDRRVLAEWMGDDATSSGAVARVTPLMLGTRTVGAVIVRRLLAHRAAFDGFDAEVFSIISELAATAMLSADHRDDWTTLTVAGA